MLVMTALKARAFDCGLDISNSPAGGSFSSFLSHHVALGPLFGVASGFLSSKLSC